ncbi:MAG: sulfurtransferase TusA family protein [Methanosarcinales archaeon]|nr:sulfurtransferase TusA family protein [Methanosarcinales archaeon]
MTSNIPSSNVHKDVSLRPYMPNQEPDILDTRGKSCPIPLFLTNARLKLMSPGEILEVISDCASLLPDLQSIFKKRCTILESMNNKYSYTIRLQKT